MESEEREEERAKGKSKRREGRSGGSLTYVPRTQILKLQNWSSFFFGLRGFLAGSFV